MLTIVLINMEMEFKFLAVLHFKRERKNKQKLSLRPACRVSKQSSFFSGRLLSTDCVTVRVCSFRQLYYLVNNK